MTGWARRGSANASTRGAVQFSQRCVGTCGEAIRDASRRDGWREAGDRHKLRQTSDVTNKESMSDCVKHSQSLQLHLSGSTAEHRQEEPYVSVVMAHRGRECAVDVRQSLRCLLSKNSYPRRRTTTTARR